MLEPTMGPTKSINNFDALEMSLSQKSILSTASINELKVIFSTANEIKALYENYKQYICDFNDNLNHLIESSESKHLSKTLHRLLGVSTQLGCERIQALIAFLKTQEVVLLKQNHLEIRNCISREYELLAKEINVVFRVS